MTRSMHDTRCMQATTTISWSTAAASARHTSCTCANALSACAALETWSWTTSRYAGAFVNGFNPNGTGSTQAAAAPFVPPKPPKDPISEDPAPVTATATPRATPQQPAPAQSQQGAAGGAGAAPDTDAADPAQAPPTVAGPAAPPLLPAFFKSTLNHVIDQQVMDYRFGDMLGDTFMFLEAQHSGNITSIAGGNRIGWRGIQMLEDGEDVGMDLVGGLYEAGSATLLAAASVSDVSTNASDPEEP